MRSVKIVLTLYLFVFLMFFYLSHANAQFNITRDTILQRDSLIKFDNLEFLNKNESDLFFEFTKKKSNLTAINLILEADALSLNIDSIFTILENDISYLRKKTEKYKERKKIRFIYSYIHERYFDKYVAMVPFSEIFQKKHFNCLTASLLYSFFLEKLNIPYEGRLSHEHVYLVAYPNSHNIIIETTNPRLKIGIISESYKQNFVQELRDMKIIGSEDFNELSFDEIFTKYYFNEELVSYYEMAGAYYMNLALSHFRKNENIQGWQQLKKSHILNPSFKSVYLLLHYGVIIIKQEGGKKVSHAEILGVLSRFTHYGITQEIIESELLSLSRVQLLTLNDTALYFESFNKFANCINDSTEKVAYMQLNNQIMAHYHVQNGSLKNALYYAEQAFFANPDNKENELLLTGIISNLFLVTSNVKERDEIFERIENYLIIESILANNSILMLYRIGNWIDKAEKAYATGRIATGDTYLKLIEENITDDNLIILQNQIQNLYIMASVYYYSKYNNRKAKEYISKGLLLFPESYELKRRLGAL